MTRKGSDLYELSIRVRTGFQAGFLFPMEENWVFLSDGETSKLNSTIGAFLRSTFPILVRAYLPSGLVLAMIDRLRRKYDSVLVTEGTITTQDQTSRIWKEGAVEFSAHDMDRVARRDGGKWTSISFRCVGGAHGAFSCRVYERGHLTLYSGNFTAFFGDVLLPYFADALAVHESLRGKERRDSDQGVTLNPLTVQLQKDISSWEMELLRERIVSEYIAAVTHPGNPMLMIQLSDRTDGSVYDLYAYGKRLEVVPLQKASPESFSALLALISDVLPTGLPELTEKP